MQHPNHCPQPSTWNNSFCTWINSMYLLTQKIKFEHILIQCCEVCISCIHCAREVSKVDSKHLIHICQTRLKKFSNSNFWTNKRSQLTWDQNQIPLVCGGSFGCCIWVGVNPSNVTRTLDLKPKNITLGRWIQRDAWLNLAHGLIARSCTEKTYLHLFTATATLIIIGEEGTPTALLIIIKGVRI